MKKWLPIFSMLLPLHVCAANSPAEAMSQLWRAMSRDPGKSADVAALGKILHEDGIVFGGHYGDRGPVFRQTPMKDFLAGQSKIGVKGFYECEVVRHVREYDRFATVYSVVESRTDKAASKADFVGVNSIQLYKFDDGWKVVSLFYHLEAKNLPIPLEGNVSGKCID